MRAFIGIDFDDKLKKEIYDLQQRLKRYAVKGRWKHSDNFHLTLTFLNEVNLQQQRKIDEAMKKICLERKPFKLEISELGIFDGRDAVRVLWLGLKGDLQHLQTHSKDIDREFAPIGFPSEKRGFTPHVTIGQDIIFECPFDQIRSSIGPLSFDPVIVNNLYLFKSEQIQGKRIYSKVSQYTLL
jgi:2''-5'' RNA ligase